MRRLLLMLSIALVVTACSGSEPVAVEPVGDPPASGVLTGRAALAAAEGEPHVLWFWGAH